MADEAFAGPVDYLVFAFPEGAAISTGLHAVLERVDAGVLEILDLELIGRDAEGAPVRLSLADLDDIDASDLAVFDGVTSGILDADDRAAIADGLEDGQFAVALVYEDRSLASAAAAWTSAGGSELFSGGVAIDDLEDALSEGTER
ncbi:DUF6325 family protein [Microbacterium sp.]|uniref:DUF6325 family protein n=1 Tax=Microbacterium sp. TaxID=51671 RepID=UPI00092C03F3|nr:DUF6325 family protein [Microbacterium sp.]MBN9187258.1 hypothetical protein [Microbacterium sp.]MBN9192235.1 hypothetical protein [Microbacterium sp.]OJU68830.1 MAG: hypothetical protein BGO04_12495 [Microbacterium sp. 70-38]